MANLQLLHINYLCLCMCCALQYSAVVSPCVFIDQNSIRLRAPKCLSQQKIQKGKQALMQAYSLLFIALLLVIFGVNNYGIYLLRLLIDQY